ncbi:MAG TPA: outer membrane beta-barrel protein [Novosphingobium sp.]|nr:outer membrane beta-barrel protein [Novosphingobium sp.]
MTRHSNFPRPAAIPRPMLAVALGAAALAGTAPAMAQAPRIDYENPDMQIYAGPIIGYDNVAGDGLLSGNRAGVTYGGVVGADSRLGERTRIGVEAELTGSTTNLKLFDTVGNSLKVGLGRDIYVGAKFGYFIAPKVQAYLKAGYTNQLGTLDFYDASGVNWGHFTQSQSGYRVGAGAEYMMGHARMRLEYRYSDYGKLKVNGVDTGMSFSRHQVMAGMLYGF